MRLAIDVKDIPPTGPSVGNLDDLLGAVNRRKSQQDAPLHQVPIVTVPLVSQVSPVRLTLSRQVSITGYVGEARRYIPNSLHRYPDDPSLTQYRTMRPAWLRIQICCEADPANPVNKAALHLELYTLNKCDEV